jgi:hypothetical protein
VRAQRTSRAWDVRPNRSLARHRFGHTYSRRSLDNVNNRERQKVHIRPAARRDVVRRGRRVGRVAPGVGPGSGPRGNLTPPVFWIGETAGSGESDHGRFQEEEVEGADACEVDAEESGTQEIPEGND